MSGSEKVLWSKDVAKCFCWTSTSSLRRGNQACSPAARTCDLSRPLFATPAAFTYCLLLPRNYLADRKQRPIHSAFDMLTAAFESSGDVGVWALGGRRSANHHQSYPYCR